MTKASQHQPDPKEGDDIVLFAVMADLEERAETGKAKYGTYLKTHNGRDPLWDALQEVYDLTMYLKQYKMEYDEEMKSLWNIHAQLAEAEYLERETIVLIADSLLAILKKNPANGVIRDSRQGLE